MMFNLHMGERKKTATSCTFRLSNQNQVNFPSLLPLDKLTSKAAKVFMIMFLVIQALRQAR